jgi:hypothetical protein
MTEQHKTDDYIDEPSAQIHHILFIVISSPRCEDAHRQPLEASHGPTRR